MSGTTIALLLFVGMLLLMALRVPIALAMFVPGAVGYVALSGWPPFANFLKGLAWARLINEHLQALAKQEQQPHSPHQQLQSQCQPELCRLH